MTQVQQSPAFFVGADSTKPEAPTGVSVSWTWLSTFLQPLSLVSWKRALQRLQRLQRAVKLAGSQTTQWEFGYWRPLWWECIAQDWELNPKLGKGKRLFIYRLFKSDFLFTIMSDSSLQSGSVWRRTFRWKIDIWKSSDRVWKNCRQICPDSSDLSINTH